MKAFIYIIIGLFFVSFVSANGSECFEFRACVDGSDWLYVEDGHLTMAHGDYSPIGSHNNCAPEYHDVVFIDNDPITIGYDGQYKIGDSFFDVFVELNDIQGFSKNGGRGSVSQNGNSLYIDDNSYGGGDVYTLSICGAPYNEVPEFTVIAAGIALIGALAIFIIRRR